MSKLYPDVYVDPKSLESIKKLQAQLLSIGKATGNAVKGVLARTAYYGREGIVKKEESMFKFGQSYSKKYRETARVRTVKDPKEGWYIIGKTTSQGGKYRLVQYSFENVHAMRSRSAFTTSVEKAYVSSKMLNLFEHDTKPYKANSPWIQYAGGRNFRYTKGGIRRGKTFYMAEYKEVEKAIPTAIGRTEAELQGKINAVIK